MGGGRWDTTTYKSVRAENALRSRRLGVSEDVTNFAYSNSKEAMVEKKVHPNLDPKRINRKPFGKLESRDSVDHPESNPVFVVFDVTGSNKERAVEAQKKLPNLMNLLEKYIKDPQILIAANDDFNVEPQMCIQISDYESDNRIDDHIRNVALVGDGGGNMGESYDLMLYAAARKTILDSMEVRGKKGYLFLYADEPFFNYVDSQQVKRVFGDELDKDIPIKNIIEEARMLYNVFIIWPDGGYIQAREQFVKLFGKESVLTLQNPNLICELIGSVIGINEDAVSDDEVESDLVTVGGATKKDAASIIKTVRTVRRKFRKEEEASA